MNEDVISRKMMLYCLQFVYTGSCKVKLSETGDLAQIANGLLLDELGSFCGNMQTFSNQIDECKVMNASITTYWLDSCAELYKEVLLDRGYKSDIIIRTKRTVNVAQDPVAEEAKEEKAQNDDIHDNDDVKGDEAVPPQNAVNEGNEQNDDQKENDLEVVGREIYQTPNAPFDDDVNRVTAEGDVADIVNAPPIEPGPGNGDDAEDEKEEQKEEAPVENVGEFRAHKVIPWSRCDVFQAMLNHNFNESNDSTVTFNDVRSKTFGVFLEFLYTDHAQIDDDIVMELLEFSNKMRETRLISWCEYLMSKVIERAVEQSIEKADLDIIGLLLAAQRYNAKQLEEFLFHFISTNYVPMSKKKEFKLLKGDNLKRVEKNRWPPKWYEDELREYQKELEEWQKKYGDSTGSGFFGRRKSDKKGNAQGNGQEQDDDGGCLIM